MLKSPHAGGDTLTNTADVVLGIANIYYSSGLRYQTTTGLNIVTSYNSICLVLNVLLTLMIVIRLIVHIKDIRGATGALDESSGLHTAATAVVMMLIESNALYAGVLLVYTIPWAVNSWVADLFSGIVGPVQVRVVLTIFDTALVLLSNYDCTQVIAPYLIILRVAKRRAMTSELVSGTAGSMHFRSQGMTVGDETLPDGDNVDWVGVNGEGPGELGAGTEDATKEVPS